MHETLSPVQEYNNPQSRGRNSDKETIVTKVTVVTEETVVTVKTAVTI